jgi:hypothetical protein
MAVVGVLAASITSCGGGFSVVDAASNAAEASQRALANCAPDSGTCSASEVRALESLAYCDNVSILYYYGKPAPDAGLECQPP